MSSDCHLSSLPTWAGSLSSWWQLTRSSSFLEGPWKGSLHRETGCLIVPSPWLFSATGSYWLWEFLLCSAFPRGLTQLWHVSWYLLSALRVDSGEGYGLGEPIGVLEGDIWFHSTLLVVCSAVLLKPREEERKAALVRIWVMCQSSWGGINDVWDTQ